MRCKTLVFRIHSIINLIKCVAKHLYFVFTAISILLNALHKIMSRPIASNCLKKYFSLSMSYQTYFLHRIPESGIMPTEILYLSNFTKKYAWILRWKSQNCDSKIKINCFEFRKKSCPWRTDNSLSHSLTRISHIVESLTPIVFSH